MTDDEFAAYQSLAEDSEDHRWAFGTGFTDPLEGIDASVPDGVDAAALAAYCLMLGDDALIYSHRLQQWMTRLPELEEETALANIALDLLGQARMLLARAGQAEGAAQADGKGQSDGKGQADGRGRSEDELAFFRNEHEFRNVRLVERMDADFAELTARLLVFSTWRLALFGELAGSRDPVLAAIVTKGAKELAYHRDYAAQWVIRLGDGTALSHDKMQAALGVVWPLVDELFRADPVTASLPGVAVDPAQLRAEVDAVLDTVLAAATLDRPAAAPMGQVAGQTGRDGVHTEALGYILAELQSVARAHPDATW
jgi:ring-1,2-phenylacetyl-CoA epoxidase subunit PaaC